MPREELIISPLPSAVLPFFTTASTSPPCAPIPGISSGMSPTRLRITFSSSGKVAPTTSAVSYTHLDVYKRQIVDITRLAQLADAGDHAGMVQDVNLLLFEGGMSATTSSAMKTMLDRLRTAGVSSSERVRSLLLLALASPEYAIQR